MEGGETLNAKPETMNSTHNPKVNFYYLVIDQVLLTGVFFVGMFYLPATFRIYLPKSILPFAIFSVIWIVVGVITNKYRALNGHGFSKKTGLITISDLLSLILILLLFSIWEPGRFSPRVMYGLVGVTYTFEVFLAVLIYAFRKAVKIDIDEGQAGAPRHKWILKKFIALDEAAQKRIKDDILKESGEEVLRFLEKHIDLRSSGNLFISTIDRKELKEKEEDKYRNVVNLMRINDMIRINKFFETVNLTLNFGGMFIGCAETSEMRKQRLMKKILWPFNYIYYSFDYLLNRVAPKFFLTKRLYFYITSGYNRIISKAEVFGRLYSCGFEVLDERVIGGLLYFIARKIKLPLFPTDATYGSIVGLKRIGKGGRRFYAFKLRTMHPYAEYLQDYVFQKNHLTEGGKFNNDFRISTLGRITRKFWIDELPMLVNIVKGDMTLVGVRPISEHYFNLYPKELQEKRIQYKPGLLPPFYADMPKTLDEIVASEWKFLNAYDKHPFLTNWRYFWRILYNIVIRRARSK
jgi:hypothetical protein